MNITMTRQAMIARLEARRPDAAAFDERSLAAHRKAEQTALTEFRRRCRDAVKLTYDELKALGKGSYSQYRVEFTPPGCPVSQVDLLDKAIVDLGKDTRARISIDERSQHFGGRLYHLLTADFGLPKPTRSNMCEPES